MAFIFHTLILITDNSIFLSLFRVYFRRKKIKYCIIEHSHAPPSSFLALASLSTLSTSKYMPFLFLGKCYSTNRCPSHKPSICSESNKLRYNPMNYRLFPYLTSCGIIVIRLPLRKNNYDEAQRFHRNNPGADLFGE